MHWIIRILIAVWWWVITLGGLIDFVKQFGVKDGDFIPGILMLIVATGGSIFIFGELKNWYRKKGD